MKKNLVEMSFPLVSIITPSFNQGRFILQTITSVLGQDYAPLEHIVIDGGSSDNTLDVLRAYQDRLTFLSEPDKGQADAVNKGFERARGSILGWLNSDDIYEPHAVRTVVDFFQQNPRAVMVYGDAKFINTDGGVEGYYPSKPFSMKGLAETCIISQPATFIRADVVRDVGPLDVSLTTCMDYDYWIRIAERYGGSRIAYLEGRWLARARLHDETKTSLMRKTAFREGALTVQKHFGFISATWAAGFVQEVSLPERYPWFKDANIVVKAFLRWFYTARIFGLKTGIGSVLLSLKRPRNMR